MQPRGTRTPPQAARKPEARGAKRGGPYGRWL